MGLVYWWDLNDSLIDKCQAISLTNYNTTANTTGKMGFSRTFGSAANSRLSVPIEIIKELKEEFSISFWMNVTAWNTSYCTFFGAYKNDVSWANNIISFLRNGSKSEIAFCIANGSSATQASCSSGTLSTGIWYHITGVYKPGNVSIYVNGELKTSFNTTIVPNTSAITYSNIGAANSTQYQTSSKMCDFRIYNHALSKKEIRELSRGLLLHYNFNNADAEPTVNLLSGKSLTVSRLTVATSYTKSGNKYTITTGDYLTASNGNKYTYATGRINMPLEILTNGKSYYFSCKYKKISGTANFSLGDFCDASFSDKKTIDYGDYIYISGKGYRESGYTSTYRFIDVNLSSDSVIEIYDLQLEDNDHATEYVDGIRDECYIYDASGHGNHATNSGMTLSTDTNIGKYTGLFGGDNKYIYFNNPFGSENITECSWAFWLKLNSSTGYQYIFGQKGSPSTSGWIAVNTEGYKVWFYNSYYAKVASGSLSNNVWYHIALTYKSGIFNWYIDGVNVGTVDATANKTYIPYAAEYSIGDSYTGTQWTGTPFDGCISDFKIYATQLSGDDVKRLYDQRIVVDKIGNLYANSLDERTIYTKNKMLKPSVIETKNLHETIHLSDGSKWMKIMHHDNKSGTNLFSSDDNFSSSFVYHNEDCWSAFNMIENLKYNNVFEFYIKQENGESFTEGRWTQTNNPATSTSAGTVTKIISTTDNNGLVKCSDNTFLAVSNSSGNWWQACGCYKAYNGGIPGFNKEIPTGILDLYVRIYEDPQFKISKSGIIHVNEFHEI